MFTFILIFDQIIIFNIFNIDKSTICKIVKLNVTRVFVILL